jgi:hypothetical protein
MSQDQGGQAQMSPEEMEVMRLWQEIGSPGDRHKLLDFMIGDWETTMHMWAGPEAPPQESRGSASAKWILGGRFVQTEFHGEMMGMPFDGLGLFGYDNYKKKFVSAWVDSMGTAMYATEGLADQTGKVITMFGTMDEWMTGEHDKMVKYVYTSVDENTYRFEIHDLGIVPGETKVAEVTYVRKE